jgi:hypothetical protein
MSRAGLEVAGSLPRASEHGFRPCDGSLAGRRTPVTFHHARPAVAAVGLERRPPDGPGHLPSDRPGPCGPSGLGGACCSRALPRPAPCRSPRAWACLVKGLLVASSYPAPLLVAASQPLRRSGKMRLTDFCNRLPSRAPCGLLGSWSRPLPRATLRCLVAPRVPHGPRRRNAGSPWASARRWRGSGACLSAFQVKPTKWSFA